MKKLRKTAPILVILSLILLAGVVWAGSSASYAIDWQVISSGGAPATSASFSLNGSILQTAIGPSSSASYTLGAGFWVTQQGMTLYLPMVMRGFADLPDLVIDSITANSNTVQVVIRNAGKKTVTDDFWVDVSFNPSTRPPRINQPWKTIASRGVVWGVTRSLAPGETLSLVNNASDEFYFGPPESSAPPLPVGAEVWGYVDSVNFATTYGAVQEINEANNTASTVSTAADGSPSAGQSSSPSRAGLPPR